MRKLIVLLLAFVLVFSLCCCDNNTADEVSAEEEAVVLSPEEQRKVYHDAAEKTVNIDSVGYDVSMWETVTYLTYQDSNSVTVHAGENGNDWYGEYTENDVSFDCFYVDGYIHTNESGSDYKAPMTEAEFADYTKTRVYPAVGDEYAAVNAVLNDDGTYTVSLNGMLSVPEALAKHFQKLGMTDIAVTRAAGFAEINEDSFITHQTAAFELSMSHNGEPITAEYSVEITYTVDGDHTVKLPPDREYMELENISIPFLVGGAYDNVMGSSYYANYRTFYDYINDDTEYSMELNYGLMAVENYNGFEASDQTTIIYNTVNSGKTVEKSSKYSSGKYKSKTGSSSSDKEKMTDEYARNMYFRMLLDYEPQLEDFKSISVNETENSYELRYEYSEYGTLLYCQNVLTALIGEQEGIAVNSDDYTITASGGTIRMDKDSKALTSHEIYIETQFDDGDDSYTVVFEHILTFYYRPTLVVGNAEAAAGEAVEVSVYLYGNTGTACLDVEPSCDTNVLSFVSAELCKELSGEGVFETSPEDAEILTEAVWADSSNYYGNGLVMTVTFQVAEDAPPGDYTVSLVEHDDDIVKAEGEDTIIIEAGYVSGTIKVF
ncbi:MAG: hypothetical protein E7456_00015 [Ruminococcaceae bacterium]|nr:hypothetical protein [Oscillospiraceae bacterium]